MLKRNTTSKKVTLKGIVKSPTVSKGGKRIFKSDARQTAALIKAGRMGAANAIRASRALGLPITYLQNGTIYEEYPDGSKKKIESGLIKKGVSKKDGQILKKGMVLHARK
ncbi:MAG TPA: hypothetical protein VMU83_14335 [Hanamia sp.]|nr:hypothetical protein [Hanamia sp.]